MRRNWRAPEIDPELRPLAEAEAAARNALDHAMARGASFWEIEPLRVRWIVANDALADALWAPRKAGFHKGGAEPPW